jgi:small subunit ribosomal protein S4
MNTRTQYKLARRLGASIFPKTQTQKFALALEKRAQNKKRGRGMTEYGKQLIEKQKIKATYGLSERQFRIYVDEAMSVKGVTPIDYLHERLERRLDNIVFRMNLAPSRRAARQMVSHGHIIVNGTKSTVPSQKMFVGDTLAIREGSKTAGYFANFADKFAESKMPSWLSFTLAKMTGEMTALPTKETAEAAGDLSAVLSFYSR